MRARALAIDKTSVAYAHTGARSRVRATRKCCPHQAEREREREYDKQCILRKRAPRKSLVAGAHANN